MERLFRSKLAGSRARRSTRRGLHIFPGVIDAHVHFNEPGRADWEGIETGSRALAAGGGTMFFDMPLNAHPPTCDAASFDLKLAAAQEKSLTDFALWGGLVPGNLDKMEELAERGVIGFKAFMSNSGIEDFACVDDATLRRRHEARGATGMLVAVHAESESITQPAGDARKLRAGQDFHPRLSRLAADRRRNWRRSACDRDGGRNGMRAAHRPRQQRRGRGAGRQRKSAAWM